MIKINLVKPKIEPEISAGAVAASAAALNEEQALRRGGINVFILALGPLAIFMYQSFILNPDLETEIKAKDTEVRRLHAKNEKAKSAVEENKKFDQDRANLQRRIDIIEDLKKDRMHEVRLLDLIQREIPERVFLTSVEIKDAKLNLVGAAASEDQISNFMDILTKSGMMGVVSLTGSSEKNLDGNVVKEFKISSPEYPAPLPTTDPTKKKVATGPQSPAGQPPKSPESTKGPAGDAK
jgi:type IV pilus assembly protein PilN